MTNVRAGFASLVVGSTPTCRRSKSSLTRSTSEWSAFQPTAPVENVVYDVSTEPAFSTLTGEVLPPSANSADDARVDIAARGFWRRCEKGRILWYRGFNPYAPTHRRQTLGSSFNANERVKKRLYNQRIVEVEHDSFQAPSHRSCSAPMTRPL